MADGNPFQGMLNPNLARGANLWDLRMMSAANRMETPFERGMRGMYSHQGVSGNPMLAQMAGMANEPDYSAFTFDPQARAQAVEAMKPYGLQPLAPEDVKQNQILPNTGFFGRHPRLSSALEAGMFGAAAAHGGATPGESIQGTIEGIIGGKRMREGMYRQQFARPFEAAGMMENLQGMAQRRQLQEAEIQHLRAENQKLGRPDHDFRAFGVSRNDPNIATVDSTTGEVKYSSNPLYDPTAVGGTTPEEQFFSQKRAEAKVAGKPVTSQMIGDWQQEWTNKHVPPEHAPHSLMGVKQKDGTIKYVEVRPGTTFAPGTVPETPSQIGGESAKLGDTRQKFIQSALKNPELLVNIRMTPGDPQIATKLGQWFDTNLASPQQQQMMADWMAHYGVDLGGGVGAPPPGSTIVDMTNQQAKTSKR